MKALHIGLFLLVAGCSSATEDTPMPEVEQPQCGIDPDAMQGKPLRATADDLPAAARAVDVTAEGDVVLAATRRGPEGRAGTLTVQQRGPDGELRWTREEDGELGLGVEALGVAVDSAGFVNVLAIETVLYVLGESDATFDGRLVVLRYGPDGARVWRWVREREPIEPWGQFRPTGILAVDGDDVRVLETVDNEPVVALRLDRFGNLVSEHELEVPTGLPVYRMVATFGAASSVYLAANDDDGLGNHPVWVGSFDEHGEPGWTQRFGSLDDDPRALVPAPGGGVYLAYATRDAGASSQQLRRYGPDGTELWTTTLATSDSDGGVAAGTIDCAGQVVLTGGLSAPASAELEWNMRSDLWVAGFDPDGTELWSTTFEFGPPFSFGSGSAVAVTLEGDVVVSGSYLGDAGSDYEPWLGWFSG
ncbi:MAG: hypothetical protein ACE37F_22600 [Nannocystaceae bacterium]|nr:hypothetical protein [bacterium]